MSYDYERVLSPARLRAMAEWFRQFAELASVEQRRWQLDLAEYHERLATERETPRVSTCQP